MEKQDKENLLQNGLKSQTHFLVKWRGLSYLQCTWEPENKLLEFEQKIKDFQRNTRALSKEQRINYISRSQKHQELL